MSGVTAANAFPGQIWCFWLSLSRTHKHVCIILRPAAEDTRLFLPAYANYL